MPVTLPITTKLGSDRTVPCPFLDTFSLFRISIFSTNLALFLFIFQPALEIFKKTCYIGTVVPSVRL